MAFTLLVFLPSFLFRQLPLAVRHSVQLGNHLNAPQTTMSEQDHRMQSSLYSSLSTPSTPLNVNANVKQTLTEKKSCRVSVSLYVNVFGVEYIF